MVAFAPLRRYLPAALLLALTLLGCAPYAGNSGGGELFNTPAGHRMRASSYDPNWQDGNGDARPIAPGQTLTVADLQGPGIIRHLWFTIAASDVAYPRLTTLRIYWDGDSEPAVESPIGDFFAVGHGMLRNVTSEPVAVSADGRAYNCYWPMPFHKSARVTVTNDSDQPIGACYSYVDWEKLDHRLPRATPAFHAQYRQEFPCRPGDYLILDAEGKGHYVGTVLSVRHRMPSWFGEGDDRFYIDGATTPTLHGTGTEDYFSDAWGFRELNRPYYGIPLWEGDDWGSRGTAYHWHVKDPIRFDKSLKVAIEHKGPVWNEAKKTLDPMYGERPDDFATVAFWYQTGKAKRYASVPPGPERLPWHTTIELDSLVKLETLPPGSIFQDGPWSGGRQILLAPRTPGYELAIPFTVASEGRYMVNLSATRSWDYGVYDIYIDDQLALAKQDFYSKSATPESFSLGLRQLVAGPHTLRVKNVGSTEQSRSGGAPGIFIGLDALTLSKL